MQDILIPIAIVLGLISLYFTIRRFIFFRVAELRLKEQIILQRNSLETLLAKLESVSKEKAAIQQELARKEFALLKENIRLMIEKMEIQHKDSILEYLNQESLKGQRDYLNKLIHMGGISKEINFPGNAPGQKNT